MTIESLTGNGPSGRGSLRRRLGAFAASMIAAAAGLAALGAQPAQADPFECEGQYFLGQGGQLFVGTFGAGTIDFEPEGPPFQGTYNAMGFHNADGFIYAISGGNNLFQIETEGAVTNLGPVTGLPVAQNGGTITPENTYYVSGANAGSLFEVDIDSLSVVDTVGLTQSHRASDLTWSKGFLWGAPNEGESIVRIDPDTGQVDMFDAPFLNVVDAYGAAFTYGNEDIGVSANPTGTLFRVRATNPGAANPSIELISTQEGPNSANNDGTGCFEPETDLSVEKAAPDSVRVGAPISYEITITNHGPQPSAGWSLNDQLPSELDDLTAPTEGCEVTAEDMLTCTGGALAVDESTSVTVGGTAPQTGVTLENTAVVSANDSDPDGSNDSSTALTEVSDYLCQGVEATIFGSPEDDVLEGTDGDDVFVAFGGNDLILAGGGDDLVCGHGGRNEIHGGHGDDTIHSGPGANEVFGGPGRDQIDAGPGPDMVRGGPGRDRLRGAGATDDLRGGDGGDFLGGTGQDDFLGGGEGNDDLRGGPGTDTCRSGPGTDSVRSCER